MKVDGKTGKHAAGDLMVGQQGSICKLLVWIIRLYTFILTKIHKHVLISCTTIAAMKSRIYIHIREDIIDVETDEIASTPSHPARTVIAGRK
jgi:hypothetical protein